MGESLHEVGPVVGGCPDYLVLNVEALVDLDHGLRYDIISVATNQTGTGEDSMLPGPGGWVNPVSCHAEERSKTKKQT